MALIGNKSGKFVVEFLVDTEDPSHSQAINDLYRQLNFYLIEKGEKDPWEYAQHHCTTAANAYSNIHWSFFNSFSAQLSQFEDMFVAKLKNDDLPAKLLNEGELEKQFVLPIAYKCLIDTPSIHAYAHPWKQATRCKPNCNKGRGIIESPLVYHGCPECWQLSKQWAAVNFYGHHCFDIIIGKQGQSIAVELKFLSRKKTNKKANDEFQRFIGQCTLAKLVHTRVIGFCVAEERCLDFSKAEYLGNLREQGISVVIRKFVPKD